MPLSCWGSYSISARADIPGGIVGHFGVDANIHRQRSNYAALRTEPGADATNLLDAERGG